MMVCNCFLSKILLSQYFCLWSPSTSMWSHLCTAHSFLFKLLFFHLSLTPAQLTHGGTKILWMILVNGVHLQTILLVCVSNKQQLMAIHVPITRYGSSYECTCRTCFELRCYTYVFIRTVCPFLKYTA